MFLGKLSLQNKNFVLSRKRNIDKKISNSNEMVIFIDEKAKSTEFRLIIVKGC
jgi:hypothetical protein